VCLIKHHAMKACAEYRARLSSQIHVPTALHAGKEHSVGCVRVDYTGEISVAEKGTIC
jgi:hypothetical protein